MSKSVNFGPLESKLIFELERLGKSIFDFSDSKDILNTSDSSVANVLYRLKKKNRIQEIQKGKYVLNPARSGLEGHWMERIYLIVDHVVQDYYIGFWSAMNYWDMTEQLPMVTQVAFTKRKRDIEYIGHKIEFITIVENRFFGSVEEKLENGRFLISSREKTILDALTYPQHCGGLSEGAKAIWNTRGNLDRDEILKLLERLGLDAVTRRLGYLLDTMDIEDELIDELKKDFKGYRWLDPSTSKKSFTYCKKWGLKLNLSKIDLLRW